MDKKALLDELKIDRAEAVGQRRPAMWFVALAVLAGVVAVIMAVGAVFAALNTMYSAVVTRTVKIATLHALGFGSTPVVISVMIESMALALLCGAVGAGVSYVLFNGYTVSTLNNVSFSQVAFDFAVTSELVQSGLIWALTLGAVGGLFPAIRAAWLRITAALRGE